MKLRQTHVGFSIVEILVALTLIAILAAMAYPSYTDSVRKSRRSDAMVTLMSLQLAQEKRRAAKPDYATDLVDLGMQQADGGYLSNDGYYRIVLSSDDPSISYVITATPVGDQQKDACVFFAVNQDGPDIRTASNGMTVNEKKTCWKK